MWILTYCYEVEAHTFNRISFCIDNDKTYSVGRSSKNKFIIKNDKSISREHIKFTWNRNGSCFNLSNEGKVTLVNGKYLTPKEKITFKESLYHSKPIIIELGTKPIIVKIHWKRENWSIPSNNSFDSCVMESNGISIYPSWKDKYEYNLLIANNAIDTDQPRILFGLINNIKIMKYGFLLEASKFLSMKSNQFEAEWSNLLGDPKYILFDNPSNTERRLIFHQLKFYLLNGNPEEVRWLKSSIELAGGSVTVCDVQALLANIDREPLKENLIVIQMGNLKESIPDIFVHTVENLVDAAIKGDLNPLLDGVKIVTSATVKRTLNDLSPVQEVVNETPDKNPAPSTNDYNIHNKNTQPAKRRRMNRERIQPLDSLMFFGGGDSVLEESYSQLSKTSDSQKQVEVKEEPHITEIPSISDDSTIPSTDYETTRVAIQKNENISPISSANEIPETESICIDKDNVPSNNKSNNKEKRNTNDPIRARRSGTLSIYKANPKKGNCQGEMIKARDFVQVIQDTKKREVNRLNSTLVQVDVEELTHEAILKLGNVTLIEENPSLFRKPSSGSDSVTSMNSSIYKGRKNFKAFKKVLPKHKSRQLGSMSHDSSSSVIRNNAYLVAREYVPLKKYSTTNSTGGSQKSVEFKQTNEIIKTPSLKPISDVADNEDDHSFSFSRNEGSTNTLFVMDEDDSQTPSFEVANNASQKSPILSTTRHTSVGLRSNREIKLLDEHSNYGDTDDDDDDEPKFSFKRQRKTMK